MLFSSKAADDTDRIRVKICGLTREDDVVTAIEAGADAVGFVCYPGSSRYVTPSRLMALTSLVPESVSTVLVFVNPTSEEVREHLRFIEDTPAKVVAYTLDNHAGGDEYEQILVAFNGNDTPSVISVPQGEWRVLVDNGKIDLQGSRRMTGSKLSVAANAALIVARK